MSTELDLVYKTAFDLIQIRLQKRELVLPFTVMVSKDAQPKISTFRSASEDSSAQLDLIRKELKGRVKKENIVALCLCYTVHMTDPAAQTKIDAVAIERADQSGAAIIYIPYNFDDSDIIKKSFQVDSKEKYFT